MKLSFETGRWPVFVIAVFLAAACLVKAIRVFLLDPRNLGLPSGAAEDWMIGMLVFSIVGAGVRRKQPVAQIGNDAIVVFCIAMVLLFAQDLLRELIFRNEMPLGSSDAAFRTILATAFLFAAWGVHTWQRWGRILCILLALSATVGTVVIFFQMGFDWRLVSATAVLCVVFGWLFLPAVRTRFLAGDADRR
jgi:ABC-type cobalt transport system substrate-binding protein